MNPEQACNYPIDLQNHYGYIYCLTFPNGKKYVGQTIRQWKERWRNHKNKYSCCCAVKNAIIKYKICDIEWKLLSFANSLEELNTLQENYISSMNTVAPFGYNLKSGGRMCVYSEQTKKKIGFSNFLFSYKKKHDIGLNDKIDIQIVKQIYMKKQIDKYKYTDTGFNILSYVTSQTGNSCITVGQFHSKQKSIQLYKDQVTGKILRNKLKEKQKQIRGKRVCCLELNEIYSCTGQAIEKHPEWRRDKINSCCVGLINTHCGYHFYRPDDSDEFLKKLREKWRRDETGKSKYSKQEES